jgi:hypothetical protein
MAASLRTDGDFCHQGQDTEIVQQNLRLVETYWHDHSLERSWGALSDGTISISGRKKSIFCIFLKKPQSLKS